MSKASKIRVALLVLVIFVVVAGYRLYADHQLTPRFRSAAYKATFACERVASADKGDAQRKEDEASRLVANAHAEARTSRDRQVVLGLDMLSAMSNSIADAPSVEALGAERWSQAQWKEYDQHYADAQKALQTQEASLKGHLD